MRFRLKLQVDHNFGSILPLNYQLEVSRLIYDILTEDSYNFKKWLNYNDIPYKNHSPFFNFSNIIVVDRKIYGDRMLILSDTIELTISFLYSCCTEEFVYYAFENLIFKLGDAASKIRLKVVGIEKLFSPKFSNKMQFIARSPIVLRSYRNSRLIWCIIPFPGGITSALSNAFLVQLMKSNLSAFLLSSISLFFWKASGSNPPTPTAITPRAST